jgi:hypothetical protein
MIERLLAALDANSTEPGGHVDALLAERLRNRALMWADFGQVLALVEALAWDESHSRKQLN